MDKENIEIINIIGLKLKLCDVDTFKHLTFEYLLDLEAKNIENLMLRLHYKKLNIIKYELVKYGFAYPSEPNNLFYDKQIYHFIHTENEDIIVLQKYQFEEHNVSALIRKFKINNLID